MNRRLGPDAMRLNHEQLSQIANEMVRIKAEYYGKGPVSAKAFQNDAVVLCVMRGGLTTVEQTLVGGGDEKLVQQVRLRFQEQMTDRFTAAVERVAGRRVVAYSSQIVFDPDYIFELCVLDNDADGESTGGEPIDDPER